MKNVIYLLAVLMLLLVRVSVGQTNVSGNILVNTTWTLANSPYLVVDTVVVFPGVTLTIQPGVVVKFADNKRIEIRRAKIIAIGTATDSITFTSNNSIPVMGIYGGIYINSDTLIYYSDRFSYCNFKFANTAILKSEYDTLIVKHSTFTNDSSGIANYSIFPTITNRNNISVDSSTFRNNICGMGSMYNIYPHSQVSYAKINYCTFSGHLVGLILNNVNLKNSIINSNQTGIFSIGYMNHIENCIIDSNSIKGYYCPVFGWFDSIFNCKIRYNAIGIHDDDFGPGHIKYIFNNNIEYNVIGIKNSNDNAIITCNNICNNTQYGFEQEFTSINISHNYWCTSDSATASVAIYCTWSCVQFMPIDTVSCFPDINVSTNNLVLNPIHLTISPNPFTNSTTITLPTSNNQQLTTITITDVLGKEIKTLHFTGNECVIEKGDMERGIYFVQITDENKNVVNRKIVIQ